jgi:competence protein ComEC
MKKKIGCLFILTLLVFTLSVNGQMQVHFINVGQGNATLVEFPCGAILIDAGGETNTLFHSSDSLKSFLDDFFDKRSDLNHAFKCVYLTHPHIDHTRGVSIILDSSYLIKNAVTDGLEHGSGKSGQINLHRDAQNSESDADANNDIGLEAITTNGIGSTGLTDAIIDPVICSGTDPVIRILWGTSTTNPGWNNNDFNDENNHSLVIRIDYGASSLLITGDLEEAAIHDLVSKYNGTSLLDADVYVVGHHGSKNGTTQELLNRITPEIALIGSGDTTRKLAFTAWFYGHPNKGILDMLQESVTLTRPAIKVKAGLSKKKFVDYTITKAIYATGWDGTVDLEADSLGHWRKLNTPTVPGLVNINTATLSDLETLPGIGAVKAHAIIDFRSRNGNFSTADDLDKVPGIGPATITLIKPYITF